MENNERPITSEIPLDPKATIEQIYDLVAGLDSDIKHHLSVLNRLASGCRTVCEFGTRTGLSTVALMAGHPETVVTWDIVPWCTQQALTFNFIAKTDPLPAGRWNTKIEARCGDTLKISSIEPVDMLFIDSLHNFEQLRSELKRHGNQARNFIALHDTAPSAYGYRDETGSGPGLRAAIRWFQDTHNDPSRWHCIYDDKENHPGLIVLQRATAPHGMFLMAEVYQGPKELE